jgi:hypothetical protein
MYFDHPERDGELGRFGFSWFVAVSLRNPGKCLLGFLGFPWILSSGSRLINGLHAYFCGNFFTRPLPDVRGVGVGERGRAREENTISHGVQHNSISNYLQYFATVGAFHTLNPKRLDTRHNGPDGEEPPGPHFVMTHATR